jgi:hypothetical protein
MNFPGTECHPSMEWKDKTQRLSFQPHFANSLTVNTDPIPCLLQGFGL